MTIDIERTEALLKAKVEAARQALEEAQTELEEFETFKKLAAKYASPAPAAKPAKKKVKVTAKATVKKATKKVAKKATKKVAKKATTKKATAKVAAKKGKKKVTKKKTAKKSKAKSATNSVTDASRKNAAEGRRAVATGERPPLKDSMVSVMGKKTMNAQAVVDALAKKKWLPASSDHRQYISFMLSNNCPDTFERTAKRGYYKVAKGAATSAKNSNGNGNKKKGNSKGKKGPQAKPDPQVDADLKKHWGIETDGADKGADASATTGN